MPTGAASRLDWLNLLEVSGPFLSPPVLDRVFPQGLDALDTDHAAKLRLAREDWAENQLGQSPDPAVHNRWIRLVLAEALGYTPELLAEGDSIPSNLVLDVHEHQTTLRPDFVVVEPSRDGQQPRPRLLIAAYPLHQDPDGIIEGSRWAAPPSLRMTQFCRETGVRLGLITNGERWMLVDAPRGETSAYVSWYASLWPQEPDTLRAFQSLLHVRRFFGVDETDTLEAMLVESASYQAELTDQLGAQVRRAVEVLIQALDRADADTGRKLLHNVGESELYEAAITVMMRLVFLFFAEENGLLLLGDELYDLYYSASMLRGQLREEADKVGVEVLERRHDAWSRLLATFRGIFAGVNHEALHLPAYGGSLFDPDRFPFLEGRQRGTRWRDTEALPLPVDNRTALHLLDSLQLLQWRESGRAAEARKLSFRALDIEQIGHVYESLLDHIAVRATSPQLGLVGPRGGEPEIGLDELAAHRARGEKALVDFLAEETKKAKPAVARALSREPDQEIVERIRVACADDQELIARVLPYHGLVREDPWGEPIVVRTGSIYVTAGQERRGTGTYYTPRALTEEIVTYALEPLVYRGPAEGKPRDEWELKQPHELLDLKICDLAMGSGAFLVQACRWLGERLAEAWERAGADEVLITPEGDLATGALSEAVVPRHPEERLALARRLVGDRCLYGVDVNPLAVEMAKLSLWLVTLAKGRPFSFLDHALRCGDSLLGLYDVEQVRHFHPQPDRGMAVHATLFDPRPSVEKAERRALELRRELEAFPVLDVKDAERKSRLNGEARQALDLVRLLGDLITGAALSTFEDDGRVIDATLRDLGERVSSLLQNQSAGLEESLRQQARKMLDRGKPPGKTDRRPFHWPVEFPEVFLRARPGFDAVVGNPPFRGGKRISGLLGTDYREYLVDYVAKGRKGVADLVTYFFLRATGIARAEGEVALLATNTISQGDTREVGLDQILDADWIVTRAWKSRPWPGDASVQIAQVWLHRGTWAGECLLDGRTAPAITSYLDPQSRARGAPNRLDARAGNSFIGSLVNGIGFVISPAEAAALIAKDPRNEDVVFPYLIGDDLNNRPDQSPSRWVINFFDWRLDRAAEYPDCLELVRQRVKPERDQFPDSKRRERERWWQFERRAVDLYRAVEGMSRVTAIAAVSKTLTPVFVSAGIVYSHKTVVFPYDDYQHLGILTSGFHWWWVVKTTSTLRTDINYSPTDCFETFPMPQGFASVGEAAERLDNHRRPLMLARSEGLTAIYSRVHDLNETAADILELRRRHEELDYAAAAAYGWSDLQLHHSFYETPQGLRYTIAPLPRLEILDRMLELNHEEYGQEVAAGLHSERKQRRAGG
jgi:hypothetical protein